MIIILITSLLAASLNFYMRSQYAYVLAKKNYSQAIEAVRAGAIFASSILLDPQHQNVNLTNNPDLFSDIQITTEGHLKNN